MTHPDSSRTRPESPAPLTATPPVAVRGTLASLLGSAEGRRDGVRIAIGLTVLGVLVLALLNASIYQGTRDRFVEQKWRGLVAQTDERRDALRDALGRIEQQAR